MSLISSKLKNDLLNAFNSMTDGDDSVFCKKVSKAVSDYAKSGSVTTTDTGTVSAGIFTGSGNGSISTQETICESILIAACKAMQDMTSNGDKYLAEQLATGIDSMLSSGSVSCNVVGVAISPTGVSIPLSGTSKGTFTGVKTLMQQGFETTFLRLQNIIENGNEYMAEQMAIYITSYLQSGIINTNGNGALSGSVGIGAMA